MEIKQMDALEEFRFLDFRNNMHDGKLLLVETEYCWYLVPALGKVYQTHPNRIYKHPDNDGSTFTNTWDMSWLIHEVADKRSEILYHATDTELLIQKLKEVELLAILLERPATSTI